MSEVEHLFDINQTLKHCYESLEKLREIKNVELIFEMDSSIPRELRGDNIVLEQLLVDIFSFLFRSSNEKEVLLTLTAPEDFMYEELITFQIKQTNIPKEKILSFLETGLGNKLRVLNGTIITDHESDIYIQIPFIIGELGHRRHYRLPSESMLKKKVLLIVESENVTASISKMFKYFPYDVDLGFRIFKEDETELSEYDMVVIEESLVTKDFTNRISQSQKVKDIKYVLLGDGRGSVTEGATSISRSLIKPVTQESIYELIISLFEIPKETTEADELEQKRQEKTLSKIAILENLKKKSEKDSLNTMIEERKSKVVSVLETTIGLEKAKKKGLNYSSELKYFLETFDKSDLYFRQIVNEKQTNKIKEFCIDLEKQSKAIGAESMQKFSDIVSLIFVYNKLDLLPIYPGRYHIELTKLVDEIKKYLDTV